MLYANGNVPSIGDLIQAVLSTNGLAGNTAVQLELTQVVEDFIAGNV
jgi:hypothetical protein